MSDHDHEHAPVPVPVPVANAAPSLKNKHWRRQMLGDIIFSIRWLLYPINIGLVAALVLYVLTFLRDDAIFISSVLSGSREADLESIMVILLGFVDASMVANLIIMITQGGHQIFIRKFDVSDAETPQYLDHMDTGIMKTKIALSISGITLVQLLKDFVDIDNVEWLKVVHQASIHGLTLLSALVMAIIWRIMHPAHMSSTHSSEHSK